MGELPGRMKGWPLCNLHRTVPPSSSETKEVVVR